MTDYGEDFQAARPLLKPRIYRSGDLPDEWELVTWPIGGGLIAVLTYDLPTSVRTVHRDDASGWPVPIDELFAIAIGNLETAPDRPTRTEIPMDGGGSIHALEGVLDPPAERLTWYRAVLTQGWKRQLRRMFAAVGAPIERLVRVRIGTVRLEDLRSGRVRRLRGEEIRSLGAGRVERRHAGRQASRMGGRRWGS